MKGKFRILGHIGLALFVACALMLAAVPAAKVEAATAVTDVWVEFPSTDETGVLDTTLLFNKSDSLLLMRIHFKATTALVREVDKITVQFPDGVDSTLGYAGGGAYDFVLGSGCSTETNFDIDADAAGTAYTYYDCNSASYGGYRLTVEIGVDIAAGSEVWLLIDDNTDVVTSGAEYSTAYKVRVHTSQDTTPVLSKGFYIGDDQVSATSVEVSPATAGAENAQYSITFTNGVDLEANTDTITVTFPYGTTLPSSISASAVSVYDGTWYTAGVAPTIDTDLRTVTVTTPHLLSAGSDRQVKFASTAGITNPTTLATDYGDDDLAATTRIGFIRTNEEPEDFAIDADGFTINETSAAKLNFNYDSTGGGYSDKYTMINMYSSPLYLQVEDQYGNLCNTGATATAEVTLATSSTSGGLYYGSYTLVEAPKALSGGALSFFYKDTAAGTYTLTASYTGLTSATWTMQVAPAVSLYDQYDNLINTYKPPTAGVEETAQDSLAERKGGYYVQQAIDAATEYDKVVLGDGNYEVDESTNKITLNEAYVTLKSLNGADSTTIDGYSATVQVLYVTAANVTIEDLTIKGKTTATSCDGIYIVANAFTIQNNKFTNVANDNIFVPSSGSVDISSGTITNNTITGIGRAAQACGIWVQSYSSGTIAGVNITNNTISNVDGLYAAIKVAQVSGDVTNIKIQGNTITNSCKGIEVVGSIATGSMTGTRAIANNTISGCTAEGVTTSGSPHFDLVKNTITGNKYGIDLGSSDGTYTIKYNDITGNRTFGLSHYSGAGITVTAKYNWWNDATGPGAGTGTYASLTARGSGDNVSTLVTYEPWLYKSLTDVVADNASYQVAEMKLVVGWNTLSTPVQLIAAANSVDELITSGMTIGYYYDATGWHQITTGYVLNTCNAVYVKMDAVTYVLLKFDAGAFTMPSKDLVAGWNMISLASLTSITEIAAMASVLNTAANLPGYSQVISPSMNANQTDMLGASGESWTYSSGQGTDKSMLPGLGYWVYMQNAATLAGFEITPIAPAFGLD